jgi:stringent starvation protein B
MGDTGTNVTLQRPYLLRAMHEWMTDNDLTPHIVIDVAAAQSGLPVEYAKDGRLVINVSYSATQNLNISNESASFDARFGGVSRHLDVPILAILGIYARESGQGMIFSSESTGDDALPSDIPVSDEMPQDAQSDASADTDGDRPQRGRPDLKIIK